MCKLDDFTHKSNTFRSLRVKNVVYTSINSCKIVLNVLIIPSRVTRLFF